MGLVIGDIRLLSSFIHCSTHCLTSSMLLGGFRALDSTTLFCCFSSTLFSGSFFFMFDSCVLGVLVPMLLFSLVLVSFFCPILVFLFFSAVAFLCASFKSFGQAYKIVYYNNLLVKWYNKICYLLMISLFKHIASSNIMSKRGQTTNPHSIWMTFFPPSSGSGTVNGESVSTNYSRYCHSCVTGRNFASV